MQPLWKIILRLLKKLKIELPYYPAIPFLDIYWKKMKTIIQKDTCTPMFIAALFTVAKVWKQPKCPSTDEWIKKMWYMYTVEYYSAIKNEILPFATTWMDLEGIMFSVISSQRKRNTLLSLTGGIQKIKQMKEYNKTKMGSQIQRTNKWLSVGRGKETRAR